MTDAKKKLLLDKYIDPNAELEIRLRGDVGEGKAGVNKEIFESVYRGLLSSGEYGKPDITYTVNFDSKNVYSSSNNRPDDSSYIRSLVYDPASLPPPIDKPAKLISESYYIKKRIDSAPIHDYINYSVNLNKEIPSTKKFSTKPDAKVRAKIRASFTDKNKLWRYDITVVAQMQINRHIVEILNKFFIPLTAENFIEKINYEYVNLFEVEIEHVGENKKALTVSDLNVVKDLFQMINPEFAEKELIQEEIAHVAQYIVDNPKHHYLFKSRFGMKKLANQPITLTMDKYEKIFPLNGYLATNKADGQRCIISIVSNRMRLISGKMIEIYHPKNATGMLVQDNDVTILDAELIIHDDSVVGGNSITNVLYTAGAAKKAKTNALPVESATAAKVVSFSLFVFDVMVIRDENISRLGYEERIERIDEAVNFISSFVVPNSGTLSRDGNFILKHISSKRIYKLEEPTLEKTFKEIMNSKYPYDIDGIVIAAPGESYNKSVVYKWKPIEHNTIDFLAMKVDKSALSSISNGKLEIPEKHTLYFLFVGIDYKVRQMLGLYPLQNYKSIFPALSANMNNTEGHKRESYYPIQFSPSFDPLAYVYFCPDDVGQNLDHKIVELRRPILKTGSEVDTSVGKWELMRIRNDRKFEQNYFGNDFITAESVYQNYIITFPLESLWNPDKGYFDSNASAIEAHNMWKTRNYFQRFIIGELINTYAKGANWIVDLASGRGADLGRYQKAGVKDALFIDIDKNALGELVQRKMGMAKITNTGPKSHYSEKKEMGMKTHALHKDLTENHEIIQKNMEKFGFKSGNATFVMMNFAIHYLCDKTENIRNLAKLVNFSLAVGGRFVFTTLSGKRIHELLADINYGESWKALEGGVTKYELKKLYKGTELADAGQKIAVKLPFKEELVEEPLCNIDHVINIFGKTGFELQQNIDFGSMMKLFSNNRPEEYQNLSSDDKLYSGFHNYVVLQKTA